MVSRALPNAQPSPWMFVEPAISCVRGVIERIRTVVFNILASLWQCLVRFFAPQSPVSSPEDSQAWRGMVNYVNTFSHEADDNDREFLLDASREGWTVVEGRAPAQPAGLLSAITNATLQRICANTPRNFLRIVAVDQFEKNYASCIKNGSEQNVFEQLDLDLTRNAAVYIGSQRFTRSEDIVEELMSRGMDKTRSIKILSCLSQGACSEGFKMVKQLFANIEGEEERRRHPALNSNPYPITARIDFVNSRVDSIELFTQFTINSLSPVQPLFNVSVFTRIDGASGYAEITGSTSRVLVP